jgi:transposase
MAKAFSEDLKWRIIYLWLEGFSSKYISRLFYIGEKTIYRVVNNYKFWNNVEDLKEKELGRKKIFNNSDMKVYIYYFFIILLIFIIILIILFIIYKDIKSID